MKVCPETTAKEITDKSVYLFSTLVRMIFDFIERNK